jgi:transglutaminase-like putative cysteine protease
MEMFQMNKKLLSIILTVILSFAPVLTPVSVYASTLTKAEYNQVLEWNKEIFSQNPTDEKALAYFMQPSDDVIHLNSRIESDHPEIIRRANAIVNSLPRNQRNDDYAKAKAIHQWVASNVWFDQDSLKVDVEDLDQYLDEANTSLNTLRTKRGVCSGFAKLTIALLRAVDIPAMFVHVWSTFNDDSHAVVEAYINEKWIIMDPVGDGYQVFDNGKFSKQEQGTTNWFDVSIEDMSEAWKFNENKYSLISFAAGILVPDGMTIIPEWMFAERHDLTNVTIPDGVLTIGYGAFAWNDNLAEVILPDTVTTIMGSAFAECPQLTTIYIPASVKEIGNGAFNNSNNVTIYGEAGSYMESYAKQHGIPFKVGRP